MMQFERIPGYMAATPKVVAMIFIFLSLLSACSKVTDQIKPLQIDTKSLLTTEKISTHYLEAYNNIARGLQKCWLADKKPLQKAQFFARTNHRGKDQKADISIHVPAKSPKRGPRIFSVHLKPLTPGAEISFDNQRLDPLNEQRLVNDIRNWARGNIECLDHTAKNEITPKSSLKRDKQGKKKMPLPKRK